MEHEESKVNYMKIVILNKRKSNVKVFKFCKSEDLVVMGIGVMRAACDCLAKDKNLTDEQAKLIINELVYKELKLN